MTRYVITFPRGAMDHVPAEDLAEVARAAHACCEEMIEAGAYVVSGGLADQPATVVGPDGSAVDGAYPGAVSGITIVNVPSRAEALVWAGKIAAACRCPQEVRELAYDADLEAMLGGLPPR